MKRYTYDCETRSAEPVNFQIVIQAQSDIDAALKASLIGQSHHLLLIGPRELAWQRVYV